MFRVIYWKMISFMLYRGQNREAEIKLIFFLSLFLLCVYVGVRVISLHLQRFKKKFSIKIFVINQLFFIKIRNLLSLSALNKHIQLKFDSRYFFDPLDVRCNCSVNAWKRWCRARLNTPRYNTNLYAIH